jgi:nucleotide-binding universal stress UspA family protein
MVAVDPRSAGQRAVEEAAVLARSHEAELVIVVAYSNKLTSKQRRDVEETPHDQVWRLSPGSLAEAAAQAAVERARPFAGDAVKIRTRCEPGRPTPVLASVSRELGADLLVIELTGGHSPSTVTPRVAKALERKAGCEVVVIAEGSGTGRAVWAPGAAADAITA